MPYYIPDSKKPTWTYEEFQSAIYSHLDADDQFIEDASNSVIVLRKD